MTPTHSIQEFVDDPIGRYREGASYLVWCHSKTLCGSVHWGRSTQEEARELTRLFDLSRHPSMADGIDVFMDSHAVESLEWSAFSVISEYTSERMPEWGRRLRRQAVLVPAGPAGAVVMGMVPLLGTLSFDMRYFQDADEAVGFLARPELAPVLAEVAPLVNRIRGVAPVVQSLRDHLEASLCSATVGRAAEALGLSPRSLQRELRGAGARFSAELMEARVRAACRLLERSNEKVEAIARRVGCTSSSQLSAMFRRLRGQTPLEYRARHKR